MSNYVFGSGVSYQQYLQAKSFVSDITSGQKRASKAVSLAVSTQTRQILASQEALAREQIHASEKISAELSQGFEALSWELEDVNRGISDLKASFHWGFSEMIGQLGGMNDALQELLKISKTPVQTVAYNHFEIARDAARQRLHGEALEELQKAIEGDHTSPGYKLEWRFHQLVGMIHLGSVNGDLGLMDLSKAEESFLRAARYARTDYPKDAAQAFLGAGWAAYCQGKMAESLAHTEDAIRLNATFGEALFQLAKVRMAIDAPLAALPALAKAIEVDKLYALKAAGDGDFHRHEKQLFDFIEALRQEKIRLLLPNVEAALREIDLWLSHDNEAVGEPLIASARTVCADLRNWPLFDILSKTPELSDLPRKLRERAASARIILRTAVSGAQYAAEESYIEEVPQNAGFIRKLGGPKQKTRVVARDAGAEFLSFRDGTGAERSRMNFVHVQPRSFLMYVPSADYKQDYKRKGKLTKGFLLATTPVTEEQYGSLVSESKINSGDLPVTSVNWMQAVDYCNALSQAAGMEQAYVIDHESIAWKGFGCLGYRLPTEPEWEYACLSGHERNGEGNYFYSASVDELAWFESNAGGKKHPVATKAPNSLGLYDMLGNVQEWVLDSYYETQWDHYGPSAGDGWKIVRGGSFAASASYLRGGARRHRELPSRSDGRLGFRVCRTAW